MMRARFELEPGQIAVTVADDNGTQTWVLSPGGGDTNDRLHDMAKTLADFLRRVASAAPVAAVPKIRK